MTANYVLFIYMSDPSSTGRLIGSPIRVVWEYISILELIKYVPVGKYMTRGITDVDEHVRVTPTSVLS